MIPSNPRPVINFHYLSIFGLLVLLSLLFHGCKNEDPEPSLPDLRIYLDRFEEEAALRGYDFDLSEVEAEYVDEIIFGDEVYCGYGYTNYDGLGKRRIEFSTAGRCRRLDTFSDFEMESFIFHEIGHAFLGRNHLDTRLCDGSPMSIMHVETWGFYADGEIDKRSNYIDELLGANIDEQCIDWESSWSNDTAYYQYDPDEYWFSEDHDGDFICTREGDDVLAIQLAPGRTASDGGKWNKTIYPNLPECSEVSFKVTLNSEGLTGTGAAVSLRVFERDPITKFGAPNSYNETLYLTTTDNPVSGELIDYQEELTIPCLSRDTWFIVIFVRLLPGTEGKISYSDIRLMVNE